MQLAYLDQDGKDRREVIERLRSVARLLPAGLHEAWLWRYADRRIRKLGLRLPNGDVGYLRWGRNVACVGNGLLSARGSLAVGNNTHFEISAPGHVDLDDDTRLDVGVMLYAYEGAITIGSHVYIGPYSYLQSEGELRIGSNVMLGPRVNVLAYTRTTEPNGTPYIDQPITSRGITIGDNVWIGAAATILDGVNIGKDAVVGAGSVVTRDVAAGTVVAGVPARYIREINRVGAS